MSKIFSHHPEYYSAEFEKSAFLGGKYFKGEQHLWPMPFENILSNQRRARNDRFVHYNFCKLAVSAFVTKSDQADFILDLKGKLDETYEKNIDGAGLSLDDQKRSANEKSCVSGLSYLMVDSSGDQDEEIKWKLILLDRSAVIDWQIGEDGNYDWVKIFDKYCDLESAIEERKWIERVIIYDRQTIKVYLTDNRGEYRLIEEKISPFAVLNMVPIIPIRHNIDGVSMIADIAEHNRRLDNLKSLQDYLYLNGSVIIPELLEGTEYKDEGAQIVYYRSINDTIGIEFKSPQTPITQILGSEIENTTELLMQLANIKQNDSRIVSGVARFYESQEQTAGIQSKLKTIDAAYTKGLNLLAWVVAGSPRPLEYYDILFSHSFDNANYNNKLEITDAINQAIGPNLPEEVNKELLKLQVKNLLADSVTPKRMSELMQIMDTEIKKTEDPQGMTQTPDRTMAMEPDV